MHISNNYVNSNLLYLGFNQDSACFACGMQDGFRIYNTDPLIEKERFEFEDGGIGYVEMLFRCKYLALVGGGQHPKYSPEEVMIWDDVRKVPIAEIHDFNEEVCSVKLRRDRIVVVLARSVRVYTFASPPQLLLTFETGPNQRGLCHLLGTTGCALLAFPAVKVGSVRIVDLANPEGSCLEFSAHTSPLTCLTFNMDGSLLATASEKGTLIRIFSTAHGAKVHELRRGTNPALIYCIRFNPDSSLLCAASSNGTVHVFSLKVPKSSTTGFTDQKILRKILSARPSFARISVPNVNKCHRIPFLCAFGSDSLPLMGSESSSINCLNADDSIVVICADGSYYKFAFNSKGEHWRQKSADFLELNY
uniref:WD_REPEATS_REGION domain-containing protein n=1 Tax=Trichuris muris TaxID=70415 RepID=A0A5S6Q1J8_TRIMR